MAEIPNSCVALMVTSPPYAVGKTYDQDQTLAEYLRLLQAVFAETWRVLVPGGHAAVNVANLGRKPYLHLSGLTAMLLSSVGFTIQAEILWIKAKGASGSCAWGTYCSASNPTLRDVHEYLVVGRKPGDRIRGIDTISPDAFQRDTLSTWEIRPESAKRVGHPAPFPVELPSRLIELYSFLGELILDPFSGSGSTALAARAAGRRFVGYDTDPAYIALAERRLQEAK
jgi:site-specific DNA-methyltransferase (adenine-specific)